MKSGKEIQKESIKFNAPGARVSKKPKSVCPERKPHSLPYPKGKGKRMPLFRSTRRNKGGEKIAVKGGNIIPFRREGNSFDYGKKLNKSSRPQKEKGVGSSDLWKSGRQQ